MLIYKMASSNKVLELHVVILNNLERIENLKNKILNFSRTKTTIIINIIY